MLWIILGVIVVFVLVLISIYNGLVAKKIRVDEAWSQIDVQLKRRHDLIPNLVETVKGYMGHERGVLESVTGLRAKIDATADPNSRLAMEGQLGTALSRLFAVAENYPALRASENFLSLQQELAAIEGELQLSRRYYNGAVRDFNTRVQSFPANLVAGSFGFTAAPSFEIENPADREAPKVRFDGGAGS